MTTLTHFRSEELVVEPPPLMEPENRSILYGMLLEMEFPPQMIEEYYQKKGRDLSQNSEMQMN